MYFSIQVGAPFSDPASVLAESNTLNEVIEDLFPMSTEDAHINWNGVHVPIGYKYDLSWIIVDLLSMLRELLSHPVGATIGECTSNTFFVTWKLSWAGDCLEVDPIWKTVSGGVELCLDGSGPQKLSRRAFIAEWLELLRLLDQRLEDCDLSPTVRDLDKFRELLDMADRLEIPRGQLYR